MLLTTMVGSRLGSYEIQTLAGRGGMGEVYRARDSRLKRTVALKILPAEFSQHPERLQRFQLEAEALAALNHPNIAAESLTCYPMSPEFTQISLDTVFSHTSASGVI